MARASGLVVALVGAAAFLGWLLDLGPLKSGVAGLVEMKANTAACFVLAGLSVWLAQGRSTRPIADAFSGLTIAIGLATIAEYLTGRDLGLDELIFKDLWSTQIGLPPGRMALATAVAFAMTGAARILSARGGRLILAQGLVFAAVLLPLFSFLAYLFGERAITMESPYTSLAINTVFAFFVLGAGILCECSERGPMAVFVADDSGGYALRRILPVSVAVTLVLGLLGFLGARVGFYSYAAGTIIFAVVTAVALTAVIWAIASSLSRADAGRDREREWLRMTLASIGDAVIATDRRGCVLFMNQVAEGLTGWRADEAEGRRLDEVFVIVDEATRGPVANPVAAILEAGQRGGPADQAILISRDGSEHPIDDNVAPIEDGRGGVAGVVLVFRDVGGRKKGEEILARQKHILELVARGGALGEALDALCRMVEVHSEGETSASILLGDGPTRPVDAAGLAPDPPRGDHAATAEALGLRTRWSRPILAGAGELLGTLALHHEPPRCPTPSDLALVDLATRTAAIAIEREKSEAELADARARLETALDAGAIATWTWDIPGDRVVADRNLAGLFSVSPEEARGGPLAGYLRAIHPDDRAAVRRTIDEAVAAGGRYETEYRVVLADGTARWVVARGEVASDPRGRAASLSGVVVDITERKHSEGRLRASEERVRLALDSAELGSWHIDPATMMMTTDERFRAIFGTGAGPLDYERAITFIHPDDRDWVRDAVGASTRADDPVPYAIEYRVVHPDGSVRWVSARGRANRGQEPSRGDLSSFDGTVADITDRKRSEEATRRRAVQFQRLADVATRINAAHDVHSVLGVVAEEARSLIGARQAAIGMISNPLRPQPINVISTRKDGAAGPAKDPDPSRLLDAEIRPIRLSQGDVEHDPRWAELEKVALAIPTGNGWLAAPLPGRDGRSMGLLQLADKEGGEFTPDDEAILVQLSRLAAIAIENARLYEELRGNDRRKDEFLAMLAHELRNPLSAIGNAVKLTTRTGLQEHIDWSMEVISRQMKHLTRLIDDLLDVSRINRGKIELRRDVVDAAPILESAVATVNSLVEERGHTLEIAIDRGNLWVDADPTRIEQVVVNLLNNAAKYSEDAGHIRLSASNDGRDLCITVRDRGVGIAPEKLPQMFELFAQGDRSLARSEGGLGIGLTVVKKLVEMHGGTVTARSEGPGLGSEFAIRLPSAARPAAVKTPPKPGVERPARGRRILVVDDNVDTTKGMARLLKSLGHEVATAYDGPEAIRVAREHRPEVIMLDIGLPGMSGYEVASTLRLEGWCDDAIIIAASGYGQDEDRRRSKEAGFDHHLVKPLDHDALLGLIANGKDGLAGNAGA